MFATILKVIPGWVWALLGFLLLAGVIYWVVSTIEDQSTTIGDLRGERQTLLEDNASMAQEIKRLKQDAEDKAKTDKAIADETAKNDQTFKPLEDKLAAAIAERQALEAALAARTALGLPDEPKPSPADPATPSKPAVTQAQIDKMAPEIDIAWEAYCVGSTDPNCAKSTSP